MLTKDGFIEANVLEWKLVDVPELDYYIADQPFPRGELLVRSKTMIDGYYKHMEVRSCYRCALYIFLAVHCDLAQSYSVSTASAPQHSSKQT